MFVSECGEREKKTELRGKRVSRSDLQRARAEPRAHVRVTHIPQKQHAFHRGRWERPGWLITLPRSPFHNTEHSKEEEEQGKKSLESTEKAAPPETQREWGGARGGQGPEERRPRDKRAGVDVLTVDDAAVDRSCE